MAVTLARSVPFVLNKSGAETSVPNTAKVFVWSQYHCTFSVPLLYNETVVNCWPALSIKTLLELPPLTYKVPGVSVEPIDTVVANVLVLVKLFAVVSIEDPGIPEYPEYPE